MPEAHAQIIATLIGKGECRPNTTENFRKEKEKGRGGPISHYGVRTDRFFFVREDVRTTGRGYCGELAFPARLLRKNPVWMRGLFQLRAVSQAGDETTRELTTPQREANGRADALCEWRRPSPERESGRERDRACTRGS